MFSQTTMPTAEQLIERLVESRSKPAEVFKILGKNPGYVLVTGSDDLDAPWLSHPSRVAKKAGLKFETFRSGQSGVFQSAVALNGEADYDRWQKAFHRLKRNDDWTKKRGKIIQFTTGRDVNEYEIRVFRMDGNRIEEDNLSFKSVGFVD